MHFPNLNDKSLTSHPPQRINSGYTGSSSYREKVREKIQNSPRNNSNYQKSSIDLSLNREATFFGHHHALDSQMKREIT